jgi:FMN-dependent NADH-azoreductase
MAKLLYIEASPRKKRSSSIAVARLFLDAYKKAHLKDEVKEVDLWKKELPEFDGDVIDAKYAIMHGQPHSEQQVSAWKEVEKIIEEFKAADKYVFSLPMWNFGIPYKLKHYFDILVQPGYTFTVTPQGYQGLVNDKKILMIYSRGGAYGVDTGALDLDLQKRYMETILNFIGFKSFESIVVEPTLSGEEKKEASLKIGREKAQQLASTF